MPPEEEKDIRAFLEEAYDKEESKSEPTPEPEVEVRAEPDAEGDGTPPKTGEGKGDSAPGENGAVPGDEKEESVPDAKFLPPEGTEQGEDTEGEGEGDLTPPEPQERVPVGWKGEAKLKWAEVPPEVRQEVVRREKEVNDVLRESSASRQFHDAFQQTIAPFQQFIAADGGDPLVATRNLMQTAAVLRVGSPQQKAQTVAQIVRQFGVDIEALDSVLAGQPVQPGNGGAIPPQVDQYINQQLAPVQQFVSGLQQRVQQHNQQQAQEVAADIDAFENNPDYPFYEDVREDMALLFDRAGHRNEPLTMEQAYEQAVRLNPKLADIVSKQQAARQAQTGNKSLQAKKRAAASLRGTSPAPAAPAEPTTLRGAIEQAWDKKAGGM